jgi:hypothetical protein
MIAFLIIGGDVVTRNYKTYEEAKNDNLFIRGWLPDILPATTTNIKTENNLDLNISSGGFTIPPNDMHKFVSKIQKIDSNTYSYKELSEGPSWHFVINNKNGYVSYELEYKQ